VKSADEDEFREFMLSRWPTLVRLGYGLTGDRYLAEDLAQTALARIHDSWSRVRRAEDPDAYARRVLINVNHSRQRKRRISEQTGEQVPDVAVPDPSALIDQRSVLVAALMQLPTRQRAVIVLRYWDDLTEAQIADILGCSTGAVKSHASRALARLRASAELAERGIE
jgi:RNA polymerase sigma-70 factor (sigma-E family)